MEEILRHRLDMKSLQNMSDILKINWFFRISEPSTVGTV